MREVDIRKGKERTRSTNGGWKKDTKTQEKDEKTI